MCFGECVCVVSSGNEWGATVFAWFAAGHTVHSGTVIICAVKCCFWLLFVIIVAVKIVRKHGMDSI